MNNSDILSLVTFGYALSAFLYIATWVFKKDALGKAATAVTALTLAGNTFGLVLRWVESYRMGIGHAPLSNLYESLVFFAWTLALVYLFVEMKYRNRHIGAFAMTIAFLSMAYASLPTVSSKITPLVPALKSNWLIAHVVICFLGYAGFAIAFGTAIMYLMKSKAEGGGRKSGVTAWFPDAGVLDELTYQLVMFGFLFLTGGIVTGAIWANSAWGSYWSWDPKEVWSAITWLVYAILIHARFMRGWRGKKIAWISILGFAAVLFTYFGVNYLPGLHSYGSQ